MMYTCAILTGFALLASSNCISLAKFNFNHSLVAPSQEIYVSNIVTTIPTSAQLQIAAPKPKDIEKILTTIEDIIVTDRTIMVKWNLTVTRKKKVRTRRDQAAQVSGEVPLEWVIKIRQFGTHQVKTKHILDQIDYANKSRTFTKFYNYTVMDLIPDTPYEICVQSRDFPIVDKVENLTSTPITSTKLFILFGVRYSRCKELITLPDSSELNKAQVAVVTAVTSASTVVVIFFVCCWCPCGKRKKKKRTEYEKVSHWMDKNARSSLSTESYANRMEKRYSVEQRQNWRTDRLFYIDRSKAIVFKKPPRKNEQNQTMENDTPPTSVFHTRYYRCRSWPYCYSIPRNPASAESTSSMPTSTLWFHSSTNSIDTKL